MPSPTTIDEFLELVRKSEVVDERKLATYLEKARAAQSLPDAPTALAEVLVRDGLLTQFQAEQFLQGKWKRFCLGKYKVLEKLGAGGMGIVYLCEHKLMRRRVAVKVLPETGSDDSASLDRFYREARAVAALDHPNIVRAYDIDQDNNLHFLVMEHVDGSSLQEIVKKTGPMDALRASHYIRQAALGLQHAHDAAGIVHRDIKPGNILVDRNGIVKILDMGLARFFHDEEDALSHQNDDDVLGTADYLAPEQALDSNSVDIRADIYSLGATFYFCLTGRTPFTEGTIAQKLIWHQTRQPKPISQLRPDVPEGVVAIVEKMMAKDSNQRPQTPQEVAEALTPWTQTPIPPPPEDEMPQLCPAAMGSDTSPVSGPRTTPNIGNDPSPTPRKVWQVSQSATPAPPTARPTNTKSSPTPPNNSRKTNPPRGMLNLELPAPTVANRGHASAPQPRAVSIPVAGSPYKQPTVGNGSAPVALPLPKTAPVPPEQMPSWGELLAQETDLEAENKLLPRAARRSPISATRRVSGLPPVDPPSNLGWIIGISSAIVVGLLLVACILAWIIGGETDSPALAASSPIVFHVNPHDSSNAYASIAEILNQLRGKSKQTARIIVQDDIAESDVLLDVPHLVIEAEEGKTITWRPSSKPGATKLFAVHKAEGVCIKGFTLDGEDRVEILANLFHHCPGAKLEDLKLRGFNKYGIWVTNCEGGSDSQIEFNRLAFVTTQKEQTALFFSIEPGIRDIIPKNRYFAFHDCTFSGEGTAVKAADLATLESIDWPPNIQPMNGR
ncbi:MAG TPA: protein kinase [Gemmataceae bacterium]|jgi:serine/threonine protein kinase